MLIGYFSSLATEKAAEEKLSLDISTVIELLFETVTLLWVVCPTTTSPKSSVLGETKTEPAGGATVPDPQPVITTVRQTIGREREATKPMRILFISGAKKLKKLTRRRREEPYVLIANVYLFRLKTYRK
nr:hypothetical protein [Edaphobacter modestus]